MWRSLLLPLTLLVAALATASDTVYKWQDERGNIIYSDNPPAGRDATPLKQPPLPPGQIGEGARREQEARLRKDLTVEVLGTIALGFVPTALARMPEPPFDLTLLIRSVTDKSEHRVPVIDVSSRWTIRNGSGVTYQNFTFAIRPGRYEVVAVEVLARSLADGAFTLLLKPGRFEVPESGCVYIGRLGSTWVRLPPGSLAQAQSAAPALARIEEKALLMVYLTRGALVLRATTVDMPEDDESRRSAPNAYELLAKARAKNCVTGLAKP